MKKAQRKKLNSIKKHLRLQAARMRSLSDELEFDEQKEDRQPTPKEESDQEIANELFILAGTILFDIRYF